MKLLIAGFYGCGNLGDEAILEAMLSGIRSRISSVDITVLSEKPYETKECYNVRSIQRFKYAQIIKNMFQCDAFILGGGGLLQDSTSKRSLFYYLMLIKLAKFFRKKIALIGQGIGPVESKKQLKRALDNVHIITVRDVESLKLLKEMGVRAGKIALTADLSFLLNVPANENTQKLLDLEGIKKCKARLIGISIRMPIEHVDAVKYLEFAALCDHLIMEKDASIVFLVFDHPDDMEVVNRILGYMKYPAHIVLRQCKPSDMLGIISRLDAVIGMRLHSLIFSAMANIPSLGLIYDPKIEIFQRMVGQPSIDFANATKENLMVEADKLIDGHKKGSCDLTDLRNKAYKNIDMLVEALTSRKVDILGVGVDNFPMDEAVHKATELLYKKSHHLIVTPNPEMIMAAQKDMDLMNIINNASLAPADGVGLMIAGRLIGRRFKGRVAGIDLMMKLVEIAKARDLKIFLFGGADGVAEEAAKKLGANVVGCHFGYELNDQKVAEKIKKAAPDILFVGLGSPKQEKWAVKHMKELNVPLIMCIGGSLDVISGRVKRAPVVMRKMGIEWLWRLMTEPRRWKRMLVLPVFLIKVLRSRLGGY